MRIIRDHERATLTLIPVESEEEPVLRAVADLLNPEDFLDYGGCAYKDDESRFAVFLHAGAHEEEVIETRANVTVHRQEWIGGIKLVLRGSSDDDKKETGRIRDMCYYGTGGLIFLGVTEVAGTIAIVTTGKRCTHCNGNMITMHECEWRTCDACASRCAHQYVTGVVHGGGVGLGVGEFCKTCGRSKPRVEGERKPSELEQHLALEKEFNVSVIYRDGPARTPRQAVQFGRFLRRYDRARRRSRASKPGT